MQPTCILMNRRCRWMAVAVATLTSPQLSTAQIQSPSSTGQGPRLGNPVLTTYRVGVKVSASRGGAQDIRAMVATPLECPEQEVRVAEESFSAEVESVGYRLLPGDGARQMLVRMPQIKAGRTGQALVTYEVVTYAIRPPEDTSQLRVPRRPDRALKRYLGPSPYIDVNHRKIRAAVAAARATLEVETEEPNQAEEQATDERMERLLGGGAAAVKSTNVGPALTATSGPASEDDPKAPPSDDWRRIEAFYDYALDNVEYEEGVDKSAVQVLQEGRGDCQAIGALFVAMCRTDKIPARLVWVHDHQYAEFYLEDATGQGCWHPIETAGVRAFGEMPLPRVILQKGDNFKVPERPRERLRYASDYLLGFPVPGGGKPKVAYVREQL